MPTNKRDRARYAQLLTEVAQLSRKAEALRERMAKSCEHPIDFRRQHVVDRSNGHGSTFKHEYESCGICFAEHHYSNVWVSAADIRAAAIADRD